MEEEKVFLAIETLETAAKSVEKMGENFAAIANTSIQKIDNVAAKAGNNFDSSKMFFETSVKAQLDAMTKKTEACQNAIDESIKKSASLQTTLKLCASVLGTALIALVLIYFYSSSVRSDIEKAKTELQAITTQKAAIQNEIDELLEGRTFAMKLGLKAREIDEKKGILVPEYLKLMKLKDGSSFFYQ